MSQFMPTYVSLTAPQPGTLQFGNVSYDDTLCYLCNDTLNNEILLQPSK